MRRASALAVVLSLAALQCRPKPEPVKKDDGPAQKAAGDPCDLTSGLDFKRDVVAPRKVKDVAPAYPESARKSGKTGDVKLELTISREGKSSNVKVAEGLAPDFDQAAIAAASQWEFTPAVVRGAPCPSIFRVTVRFLPPETAAGAAASAHPPSPR